jgi:hypothetical protein
MPRTRAEQTDNSAENPINGKAILDPRWIVKIDGKDFVTYPGLLDLGHQKGLGSIEVEPLQIPGPDNGLFAVCRAVVTSRDGEIYADLGDASPENTSTRVSKHLLRMASTRAIARALRSFTNIGMTCLEELADSDFAGNGNGAGANASKPKPRNSKTPAKTPTEQPKNTGTNPETANNGSERGNNSGYTTPPMSEAQRRAIGHIARRNGLSMEDVSSMTTDMFGVNFDALSVRDASALITNLQNPA